MLKEIVEAYPADAVSLHVVWLPMVEGDDAAAAKETGKMFAGQAVYQYYDEKRAVGLAYHNDVFPDCLKEALAATPQEHPVYAALTYWNESGEAQPLWDAVVYYPPGTRWGDQVPPPARWSKQVGFFDPAAEQSGEPEEWRVTGPASDGRPVTGIFFRNDCRQPPVDSDWHHQVRQAMSEVAQPALKEPEAD